MAKCHRPGCSNEISAYLYDTQGIDECVECRNEDFTTEEPDDQFADLEDIVEEDDVPF